MINKLKTIFEKKKKWTLDGLKKECHCQTSAEFVSLMKALNQMEEDRLLFNNHSHYEWIEGSYFIGKIKAITRFGWVVTNFQMTLTIDKNDKQIFFVGDEVLVTLSNRPKIVHVYKRAKTQITGSMIQRKKKAFFYSSEDYHCDFFVKNAYSFPYQKDDVLLAQIKKYSNPLEIEIIRVLGKRQDVGMDVTALLYENNARMEFNKDVMKQVDNIPLEVSRYDFVDRVDHRDLYTVTIDGDDAKDFDDAISIEKDGNGYILYVHIADVTYYMQEKSPLDKEAYLRSTSIYVCDRVVPMLPFRLSNGICSLNPDVDRCTLTCKMWIDSKGKCDKYDIYPSLIHSNRRCTYQLVNSLFDSMDINHPYYNQIDWFTLMADCAKKIGIQSIKRGKIDFETSEPIIDIDEKGIVHTISIRERGFSQEMIEEFMILANTCVAKELYRHQMPCMYRVHERPDLEKIEDLMQLSMLFHIPWIDGMESDPKRIQQYLNQIQDEEIKKCISYIMLRSMQKAQYDGRCLGHFGLALKEYCHFTSPIRRYSDVVVHRMLKKYIFSKQSIDQNDFDKIQSQSVHISIKEREAIALERKIDAIKMAEYMKRYIGNKFEGTITSVLEFGCFVTLDNGVEGLIPVHSLNDYYAYQPSTYSLHSSGNKHILQIGQRVTVRVTQVNIEKGQVEFRYLK